MRSFFENARPGWPPPPRWQGAVGEGLCHNGGPPWLLVGYNQLPQVPQLGLLTASAAHGTSCGCVGSCPFNHLSFSTSTVTSSVLRQREEAGSARFEFWKATGQQGRQCSSLPDALPPFARAVAQQCTSSSDAGAANHQRLSDAILCSSRECSAIRHACCAPALGHSRLCQLGGNGIAGLGGHALARVHHIRVAAAGGVAHTGECGGELIV